MRAAALAILVLLLAGCGQPKAADPPLVQTKPEVVDVPVSFDALTPRLDPKSGAFQEFLVQEDNATLPGGGSMAFQTGQGMHCAGDADNVTPGNAGWVACTVRLVREPSSLSQDVHELGIGYDVQRLSLRMAAEPVEWQVAVYRAVAVDNTTRAAPVYVSPWRRVDLSPLVTDPTLELTVESPCDAPDAREDSTLYDFGRSGRATLYVNFTAGHGKPFVEVDLARSIPGMAASEPFAGHATGEHAMAALYPTFGPALRGHLTLHVDLEAPEEPTDAAPRDPCTLTVAREVQAWTVHVGVQGADGRSESLTRTAEVEVFLDAS